MVQRTAPPALHFLLKFVCAWTGRRRDSPVATVIIWFVMLSLFPVLCMVMMRAESLIELR